MTLSKFMWWIGAKIQFSTYLTNMLINEKAIEREIEYILEKGSGKISLQRGFNTLIIWID